MKINTQQKSVKRANTKLWTLLPELLALVNFSEKTNMCTWHRSARITAKSQSANTQCVELILYLGCSMKIIALLNFDLVLRAAAPMVGWV